MKNKNKISPTWPPDCMMIVQIGICDGCMYCVEACQANCLSCDNGTIFCDVNCDCWCCDACEEACPQCVIEIVHT